VTVDHASIDDRAWSVDVSPLLDGLPCHAREQWLCAAQSICLAMAEGNGKRSLPNRT
jgi:hypothetical protein